MVPVTDYASIPSLSHTQMIILYRDPKEKDAFSHTGSDITATTFVQSKTSYEQYRILQLKVQCLELEMKLAEYEVCE